MVFGIRGLRYTWPMARENDHFSLIYMTTMRTPYSRISLPRFEWSRLKSLLQKLDSLSASL